MSAELVFLHTAAGHVTTYGELVAELAPELRVRHVVAENLLAAARAEGLTADLARRVAATVTEVAAGAALVVCTCSTIGGLAEGAGVTAAPVQRIDRAMAARAVALGGRIAVVAALASTLAPTRALLESEAVTLGRSVRISEHLCGEAWPRFEAGDREGYLALVAECVRRAAPDADVIVLAQGSMAGAEARCADLGVPILSSPRLGVEAAVAAIGQAADGPKG